MHPRFRNLRFVLFGFMLMLLACKAKFRGDFMLDGKPFLVTGCRSGSVYGFLGVEFINEEGKKLRLRANIDGSCNAVLFLPGNAQGQTMGRCGTLQIKFLGSRINNVRNIQGIANLSCQANGHTLSSQVEFENCH